MTEQERIIQLRRDLDHYNKLYYVDNAPVISDQEFDFLMHELQDLEAKHPELYDANSPTQRVGSDLGASSDGSRNREFEKVVHRYPMLSLANTYSREDIEAWYEQVRKGLEGQEFEVCCEMKYDGLSISLIYEHGKLVQAVTRGDGVKGDNVLVNVRQIPSIPQQLAPGDYPDSFELRGEILMPWESFNRLNAEAEAKKQQKFANPRNAASGTLKNTDALENPDSQIVAHRGLDAYLYYLLGEQLPCEGHIENLDKCAAWGFQMSRGMKKVKTIDEVMEFVDYWDKERKSTLR